MSKIVGYNKCFFTLFNFDMCGLLITPKQYNDDFI